jgi:hypothetical protein
LHIGDEPITFERVPNELTSESPHDAHDPFIETVKSAAIVPAVVADDYACVLGVATLNDYSSWPATLVEVAAAGGRRAGHGVAPPATASSPMVHGRVVERPRLGSRPERASARDVAVAGRAAVRRDHRREPVAEGGAGAPAGSGRQRHDGVAARPRPGQARSLFARALHAHSPRRQSPARLGELRRTAADPD